MVGKTASFPKTVSRGRSHPYASAMLESDYVTRTGDVPTQAAISPGLLIGFKMMQPTVNPSRGVPRERR